MSRFVLKRVGSRVGRATLEETRRLAVRLYDAGVHPKQIARALECGRSSVYKWIALEESGTGLSVAHAGGRRPALAPEQIGRLCAMLRKDPRQLEFEFGLWTRRMVAELIGREFGVSLSLTAVGSLLRNRLGMSPQKPVWRARQRDEEAIEAWKATQWPKIKAEAKAAGARIWWQDESSVRSDHHSGTTWSNVGQTPVVTTTGRRVSVNMVSSVDRTGRLHFQIVEGSMNAEAFIDYLKALLHDVKGKIFLIVDGHPAHRAKATKAFCATPRVAKRLTLKFLPPYAPDLNPDEWIWKHVKHDHVGKAAVLNEHQLRTTIHNALARLKKLPRLVRSIFGDRHLAYIGDCL